MPRLPFVIGMMGVDGNHPDQGNQDFRGSQAAVAEIPEFKGSVFAVPTAAYWDEALAELDRKRGLLRSKEHELRNKNPRHENAAGEMNDREIKEFLVGLAQELFSEDDLALEKRGKSIGGYHYLGSCRTYSLIGQAFARALLEGK